jgi:hypothetical protein
MYSYSEKGIVEKQGLNVSSSRAAAVSERALQRHVPGGHLLHHQTGHHHVSQLKGHSHGVDIFRRV